MSAKRLLNVKAITKDELEEKWGFKLPDKGLFGKTLFIRCNSKGEVKWDKAPVYSLVELTKRGNFNIN